MKVLSRNLDHGVFRRNSEHRAKEEIARKASRSVCRSQNLDAIVRPQHLAAANVPLDEPVKQLRAVASAPILKRSVDASRSVSRKQEAVLLSEYGFRHLLPSETDDDPKLSTEEVGPAVEDGNVISLSITAPDARVPAAHLYPSLPLPLDHTLDPALDAVKAETSSGKRASLLDALQLGPPVEEVKGPPEELYLRELRIRMRRKL